MARTTSPLRYPGGKTCIYPLISSLLRANKLERKHYVEPFAGGSGLALSLLYGGHVSDIHINDIDPAIWAFWYCVLNHTEQFVNLIAKTPVTIEEWKYQRDIQKSQDVSDPVTLGFSTFFLNRTNHSGIIKAAGVIGGLDQSGPYKIDCRFNRDNLIRRVIRISKYRNRIHLTKQDALVFIADTCKSLPETTFFCIDPPYFSKGPVLYTNYYDQNDHTILASEVLRIQNPWISLLTMTLPPFQNCIKTAVSSSLISTTLSTQNDVVQNFL